MNDPNGLTTSSWVENFRIGWVGNMTDPNGFTTLSRVGLKFFELVEFVT